ncbi:MAG: hypothetical protein IT223_01870 [Crocinitomicaceae bacterium]|nr:hypothetical protein [Crocinitomicaceae bacterium]
MKEILQHINLSVVFEAEHLYVPSGCINTTNGKIFTGHFSGKLKEGTIREELFLITKTD